MKRILIFSQNMELGGAEKSLLGLLENIDTTRYNVDLFLMRHTGELLPFIPDGIELIPEDPAYASLAVPVGKVFRKGQWKVAYGRWIGKRKAEKRVEALGLDGENDIGLQYSHLCTLPYMPSVGNGTYDAVISFLTPHYYAAEKTRAGRKIAWIHTDYQSVSVDEETQIQMWDAFDNIVSISEDVTRSFLETFPGLAGKVIRVGNFIPFRYIDRMKEKFDARQEMPQDGTIRLLSIGRFCHAKNFDNIPNICRRLCEQGIRVRWYIIGYGPYESLIRSRIKEERMEDHVILLGKRENPYPYIKACDVYVQPSRYEGHCIAVVEAQMLNKPVIITNYRTSPSQVRDGVDGHIVPLDNEKCAGEMTDLLRHREKLIIPAYDPVNGADMEALYRILEES